MKKRRIIVNNDFFNTFQVEPPLDDQSVWNAVDKMAGTQVDSLFLLIPGEFGGATQNFIHPDLVRLYEHPETDPCIRHLHEFYGQGKDPFQMLLERARRKKMEFFASIRMNDTHYLDQIFNPWVSQFYYDNLHHRIGGEEKGRRGKEFDYRKSAVRERMLELVRETLERYDVDGLELDFTRNCRFFPNGANGNGSASDCAPVMTEFIRQTHGLLEEAGKKRGRKILLCATIPCSLYKARMEGLDVPLWARLGWLDLLCLSTPFLADFDREVADAKLKVPGAQVYAGCDRNFSWPTPRTVPMETYRAMAMNYLQQGADGIYLYNVMGWTMDMSRQPAMLQRHGGQGATDYDRGLMNELGDLATLEHRDKLYLVSQRAESADEPCSGLPVTVPAKGEVTMRLRIGDDVAGAAREKKLKKIYLQTASSDCADYGNYTIKLNTVDLASQYAFEPYAEKPEEPLLFPEPNRRTVPPVEKVRRHPVRPIDLHQGINFIAIKSHRDPLTITDIELAIMYQ